MIAAGIKERIRESREAEGYSFGALAAALDPACSRGTVERWEKPCAVGTALPNLYYTLRLCAVCNVSLEWLMYGDEGRRTESEPLPMSGDLGDRLRRLLKRDGITRLELAARLGTSHAKIYQWERGNCLPSLYYLDKLCEVFNVNADDLTEGLIE